MPDTPTKEGWGIEKPYHKKKYCYFVDGMSLCRNWGFYAGELSQEDHDNPENCGTCRKRLEKRRSAK